MATVDERDTAGGAGAVAVTQGLFRLDPPCLFGSVCGQCRARHFPRAELCPYCGSEDTSACDLPTTGTLWAATAVTTAPPGYHGPVPYGFGVVELPGDLAVITRLTEADPARLRLGQTMVLTLDPVGRDEDGRVVVSYAFAPSRDGAA